MSETTLDGGLADYITHMRIEKLSPVTITDRVELLHRYRASLDGRALADATPADVERWQASVAHLAPASVNIYARHLRAFYLWAVRKRLCDLELVDAVVVPRVRKGRPHPTRLDDLRMILACAPQPLHLAYVLAAFAGLRCGEIVRLQRSDLDLNTTAPTALINGKGSKQRIVPLLAPVVAELRGITGRWVVTRHGCPVSADKLSVDSCRFLRSIGVETTLHSMRHAFATHAARLTRDPLLVRDLIGHESVATTEIYMQSDLTDAHRRLGGVADLAAELIGSGRPTLRVVQ